MFSDDRKCAKVNISDVLNEMFEDTVEPRNGLIIIGKCNADVIKRLKRYYKNIVSINRNGLLIDREWAEFLGENNFLVGLSLDGPKKINDKFRVDYKKEGTFKRIMTAISYLREYNVDFNILTVVTEELAGKAGYLYKFYKRNKFERRLPQSHWL